MVVLYCKVYSCAKLQDKLTWC